MDSLQSEALAKFWQRKAIFPMKIQTNPQRKSGNTSANKIQANQPQPKTSKRAPNHGARVGGLRNIKIDNPAIQTISVPVILSGVGFDSLVSNAKICKSKFRQMPLGDFFGYIEGKKVLGLRFTDVEFSACPI
jgi:hypothetical protein